RVRRGRVRPPRRLVARAGGRRHPRDQQVVSTGPYAVVRHPMYAGALVMMIGVPTALGSWWDLVPVAGMAAVIVARLLAAERLRADQLRGYSAYRRQVKHRLVPRVW